MRFFAAKRVKGFTLVELLVVIVILAVLAAIVLPKFVGSTKRSKEAALKASLRILNDASARFQADTGLAPICIDDLITPTAPSEGYDANGSEQPLDSSSWHGPYCEAPPDPFTGALDVYTITHVWMFSDSPPVGRVSYYSHDTGSNGVAYCDW